MTVLLAPSRQALKNRSWVLVLAASLLTSGCDKPAPAPPHATPVLVMTVGAGVAAPIRSLAGFITSRHSADIGFQAGGRIQTRVVDVGDRVQQGQTLLALNTDDYQQAVLAAQDQVAAVRADLQQSAADAQRLLTLNERGLVKRAELERQQTRTEAAKALLARANRQLELARNTLEYATLKAPFAGVITTLDGEVGQVVSAGAPVLSLAKDDDLEVTVEVPEDLVLATDLPQTSFAGHLTGQSKVPLELKLREFSPAATAPLRTFKAVFTIRNLPSIHAQLKMGMTAEVMLSKHSSTTGQISLPAAALVSTGKDVSVWVVAADQQSLRNQVVTLKRSTDDGAVVEGLEDGAQVVIAGTEKLNADLLIRPIERSGTAYGPAE